MYGGRIISCPEYGGIAGRTEDVLLSHFLTDIRDLNWKLNRAKFRV